MALTLKRVLKALCKNMTGQTSNSRKLVGIIDDINTNFPKKLVSIAVTTEPTTKAYTSGQTFDDTGMVVKAIYDDESEAVVDSYVYLPTGALTTADSKITIFYEGKTTTQSITVTDNAQT